MVFIIIAAMTKRAQIPFSSWLPAAIAAPTPVSALVHSSTLVTAGVYLLIRFSNLLNGFNLVGVLLIIGRLTMFMSGVCANFEIDFKKVIALSTLSQLGLIMGTLSLILEKLSFFHLLTHALFKALLFLCAGVLIHRMNNFQDVRRSGRFIGQLRLVLLCFSISRLALCGMPFLAGFYSKDLILENLLIGRIDIVIIFLFFFSTGLTVTYSFRLIYYLTEMIYRGLRFCCEESFIAILISIILLSVGSITAGSILS